MKTSIIVAMLVAVSASAAAPAFASGYGPAPFYRPSVGAPVSQRDESGRPVATEQDHVTASAEGYGGAVSELFQAGSRVALTPRDNLFAHR